MSAHLMVAAALVLTVLLLPIFAIVTVYVYDEATPCVKSRIVRRGGIVCLVDTAAIIFLVFAYYGKDPKNGGWMSAFAIVYLLYGLFLFLMAARTDD